MPRKTGIGLLFACLLAAGRADTGAPAPSVAPPHVRSVQERESPAQRDARMRWWRDARFGLFIHWGLYAEPAGIWNGKAVPGIGEWIMNRAKIPVADYRQLASTFNPSKFDADAWVSMARDAGVRYIVITAKHHDGFAMFRSDVNPFNIYDATPFKRDPLRELSQACQKYGVRLGFYYSQDQDWTAPGAAAIHGHWDPAQEGSFSQYLTAKAIPQIEELLSNYGTAPSVLWFDTPTKDMTPELAGRIVTVLNQHPGLIWNNRLGGGYKGDTETPEQHIPGRGYPGEDWETCMTINGTWGYKRDDVNFKSVATLLHNLIDIASKGGNYLLNVGPDATGTIPQPEVDRLRAMGRWLKVNGQAIYGTGPTPFGDEASGQVWRCTTKDGRLYLHFFQWPKGTFTLPPLHERIVQACLLADPTQSVAVHQAGDRVSLDLPAAAPDPIASVVVLETAAMPAPAPAAQAPVFAPPTDVRPIHVAIYSGPGSSEHGIESVSSRVRQLPGSSVVVLHAADFATRDLSGFDAVIFSGGSGSSQARAIGPLARNRVREYIRSGGGYLGICAGAYLACAGFDWSIGVLNARTVSNHWERGQGMMRIQLTGEGENIFGAVPDPFTIRYHNGPIIEPLRRADLPAYHVGAVFRTEQLGTHGAPAGVMIGSPAVAYAPFGKGRVLIISPHSEDTPGLENLIPRAMAWIVARSN